MSPLITSPRNIARELLSTLPSIATPVPQQTPTTTTTPSLVRRLAEDVTTVPEGYGRSPTGPEGGVVVGIVLGSVAGFLLVLWLVYTCINLGNRGAVVADEESVGTASVVTRKSRRHRHHHHHASPRRETVEIRRERERVVEPVIVPPPSVERIVVEEHRTRSRAPPPPPPPPDDDDDEVVVIEEQTPPRRRESRHHRRSHERRRSSGGYRDIDPYLYAGGDAPVRDISRRRSRSDSHRRSR